MGSWLVYTGGAPVMSYLGRLISKEVSFSGFRHKWFHKLRCMKGPGNLWFRDSILLVLICCQNYRASGRPQKKKANFAGFSGTNSRKKRPISREFRGKTQGQLRWKTSGKEPPPPPKKKIKYNNIIMYKLYLSFNLFKSTVCFHFQRGS